MMSYLLSMVRSYNLPPAIDLLETRGVILTGTGLYKVALGEDISKAENPGTFDFKVRSLPPFCIYSLYIRASYRYLRGRKQNTNEMPSQQGKAKKKSWQSYVDKGLTSDEAKAQYVELIAKLKEKYGYDANKVPEEVGAK